MEWTACAVPRGGAKPISSPTPRGGSRAMRAKARARKGADAILRNDPHAPFRRQPGGLATVPPAGRGGKERLRPARTDVNGLRHGIAIGIAIGIAPRLLPVASRPIEAKPFPFPHGPWGKASRSGEGWGPSGMAFPSSPPFVASPAAWRRFPPRAAGGKNGFASPGRRASGCDGDCDPDSDGDGDGDGDGDSDDGTTYLPPPGGKRIKPGTYPEPSSPSGPCFSRFYC